MYKLTIKKSAEKHMDSLPNAIRERIVTAILGLRENPRPPGCLKLKGEDDLWRIRVGDYRVVSSIKDDVLIVLVVRVANRKNVY